MRSIQQTKDAETLFFLEQPQALELVVPGDGEAFPLGFTRLTDYPEAPASAEQQAATRSTSGRNTKEK